MNVTESTPVEFSELWPTKLVRRRLPGAEGRLAALKSLILAHENRERNYTARYQEQNFFAREEAPVRWLKEQVDQTATAYLRHVDVPHEVEWVIHGWYNVNRFGDHHAPHSHPWCYLSGTFYVQVPAKRVSGLHVHEGARPACISFYDPRSTVNMDALPGEIDAGAAYVVQPTPGTLMMWPSPVNHYVHPNLCDDVRISISFNLVLRDGPGVPSMAAR